MKKKAKKLTLNLETLRVLRDGNLKEVAGGTNQVSICARLCTRLADTCV